MSVGDVNIELGKLEASSNQDTLLETLFHTRTSADALATLKSDAQKGLSSEETQRRLQIFGLNEISGDSGIRWYKILAAQLLTPMTAILTIGLILSSVGKDWVEAGVLVAVILTNTSIGFRQEFQAEMTMESLRKMASPTARVLRDTTVDYISANQVVPGDILLFEEGDVIPADARLIESFHLEVDEALLTGESVPVQKNVDLIENPDEPIGDRINLVYSTTTVTKGRGKAIVHRTGLHTEMGKIAQEIEKAGKSANSSTGSIKTNLEKTLDILAYFLLGLVTFLAFIVFAANSFTFSKEVAAYALSVVIAVLPEGLTAVVTITMAYGVRTMARQKAIVRKRMALEALGAVTNICSDKTGTLTQGKMVVTKLYIPADGFYTVEGAGYKPSGKVSHVNNVDDTIDQGTIVDPAKVPPALFKFCLASSLCNMATIKRKGVTTEAEKNRAIHPEKLVSDNSTAAKQDHPPQNTEWHTLLDHQLAATEPHDWEVIGDPTEAALQAFGWKLRLGKPHLASASTQAAPLSFEIIQEFAFDATLKRMSTIYVEKNGKIWVFSKGAVESIFDFCSSVATADGESQFSEESKTKLRQDILQNMELLASKGLRVLAVAYKPLEGKTKAEVEVMKREDVETNLVFAGLAGIYDPPREESKLAVAQCRAAGISVHMLTGDHPKTATSIAKEIRILPADYEETPLIGKGLYAIIATDFDKLTDEELDQMEKLPTVVARCSPVTKVKMVDALLRRRKIVAMTGDGTNDAPSLKKANVGIAMGMNGSDVAKQASDIVLTDDNFATIVNAVSEGRRIFANIQKFILHLMSGNVAEIIALIIGLAYRDTNGESVYPMSPVQVLFLNMITSSPPAMGLGLEAASNEVMDEPPRDATKAARALFTNEAIIDILYSGSLMGMFSLATWSAVLYNPYAMAQTGNTPLGSNCNSSTSSGYAPQCEIVFRARSTSFLTLTLLLLMHAYNCRSLQKSIIYGSELASWKAYYSNKFLFWSVIFGIVITIPTVYIPVVNTQAFKQAPIDWEWGIILASLVLFLGFSESYKWIKRRYFPHSHGSVLEPVVQ